MPFTRNEQEPLLRSMLLSGAACERVQRARLWRRGLGTAAESPIMQRRLNRCQSSRVICAVRQSSSGIITVMAGCGSSMSSGPQVAMSFTSRAARLSLRT